MTAAELSPPARVVLLGDHPAASELALAAVATFPAAQVSVISNTSGDITMHGLRICPDLDGLMYALGGSQTREASWTIRAELARYRMEPSWLPLTDQEIATHLVRTQALAGGYPLSEVTAALCTRWLADQPRVQLLPMTDERVESHVVVADPERRTMHVRQYQLSPKSLPAQAIVHTGLDAAKPAPGVLAALAAADLILLTPADPALALGPILGVPGMRTAVRNSPARVVGISSLIGDQLGPSTTQLLPALGIAISAEALGWHFGPRGAGGVLDRWIVDSADSAAVGELASKGLPTTATDLRQQAPPSLLTTIWSCQ